MNLSSIIVLLQLVIGLLSNQNMTPAQASSTIDLANQAIAMATQALQAPQPVVQSAPVASAPTQSIGGPDLSSIQPPIQIQTITQPRPMPSCTLSVNQSSDNPRFGNFTWTSENVSNPNGQIFVGNYFGIGEGATEFRWTPLNGGAITDPSSKNPLELQVDFQLPGHNKFKLQIGDAECEVTYTP